MKKKIVMITFGAIGMIIFTISLQKLIKYYQRKRKEKLIISDNEKNGDEGSLDEESAVQQLLDQQYVERVPYEVSITEVHPYKNIFIKPQINQKISHLHYYVLLSLSKSRGYEGVIKINITSKQQTINSSDLFVDFIGGAISYLAVNHKRIQQQNIEYKQHKILIRKQWLSKLQNTIEIIFCSRYAFMGDGLTCYFPLDENHKYSLKGQVIYVRNGVNKIARIFPCLNILNPCQIDLQLLYPKLFIAQSNTNKIQMKLACHSDYQPYKFLFCTNKSLISSTKLSGSNLSDTASCLTGVNGEYKEKGLSRFATSKLSSIHDFFFICSAISAIRPQVNLSSQNAEVVSSSKALKDVIIRYYAKQHLVKRAVPFLASLETQIIEMFNKINEYKSKNKITLKYQCKVDIFFVDDINAEGDFYSGAILLSEKTIERALIDRRLYYLLARAFVGIGILMKKKQQVLTSLDLLKLNQLTLEIFKECYDYIYVKNKQYENIRNQCVRLIKKWEEKKQKNSGISEEQQKQFEMGYWLHQYNQKQCRYFVKNLQIIQNKVSKNVINTVNYLTRMTSQEYWAFFIARYPLIEFNVSEALIKISLKYKGMPTGETELSFAKKHFIKSKYYLKFFSYQEIQNDLPNFLKLQTYGIEQILPFIKIKQIALQQILLKYQPYLNIRQNKEEGKKLYFNFKKYNQTNNFHHISALRREIKRIKLQVRNEITLQRKDIECCLLTWKLLQKLQIYPLDPLEKIKKGTVNSVQKIQEEMERRERQSNHIQLMEDMKYQ